MYLLGMTKDTLYCPVPLISAATGAVIAILVLDVSPLPPP